MKLAYVVVESASAAGRVNALLSQDMAKRVKLVTGQGRYSAHSLARSLLATREAPVALILNADSSNERLIQEQEDFYMESLRQASSGAKFQVFFIERGAAGAVQFGDQLIKFLSVALTLNAAARHRRSQTVSDEAAEAV